MEQISKEQLEQFEKWYKTDKHANNENLYKDEITDQYLNSLDDEKLIEFFKKFLQVGGGIQSYDSRDLKNFLLIIKNKIEKFRNFILQPFKRNFDYNKWFSDRKEYKGFGEGIASIFLHRVDSLKYPILNRKVRNAMKYLGKKLPDDDAKAYNKLIEILRQMLENYKEFNNSLFKVDAFFHYIIGVEKVNNKSGSLNSDNHQYWIFQGNPKFYDIYSALKDNSLKSWGVKQNKAEIKVGDKIIIWVVGDKPGCYALATVSSEVKKIVPDDAENKYYIDKSKFNHQDDGVEIIVDHNFWDYPVYKEQLSSPFHGRQGTNIKSNTKLYEEILNKVKASTKRSPLNVILYGPPGTGKTYKTIIMAAEIITGEKYGNDEKDYGDALKVFKAKMGNQIEFITFHQNYSYEDFIQGLRPDTELQGKLSFKKVDGVFKKIADRALENFKRSKRRITPTFDETFKAFFKPLLEETVESITIQMKKSEYKITAVTESTIEFEKASGKSCHTLNIGSLKRMYEAGKNEIILGGLQSYYNPLLNKLLESSKKIEAMLEKELKYVIVIDEINRANISRVFGELITLIEEDKRYGGKIPMTCTLPSGDEFNVPSNLYIIGTMNTADKSIALLDVALRRRFEFDAMYPEYGLVKNGKYREVLRKINDKIKESKKGYDFQIGHAYFMEEGELKDIMNKKVIPLLLEYFMNDEDAVRSILRKAELEIEENSWPIKVK